MDDHRYHLRRRSPGWVRVLDDAACHGLALKLRRRFWEGKSTSAEDWLLDQVISELEYRRRKATREQARWACCCELCLPPFLDE
jgi:hypothetical protein